MRLISKTETLLLGSAIWIQSRDDRLSDCNTNYHIERLLLNSNGWVSWSQSNRELLAELDWISIQPDRAWAVFQMCKAETHPLRRKGDRSLGGLILIHRGISCFIFIVNLENFFGLFMFSWDKKPHLIYFQCRAEIMSVWGKTYHLIICHFSSKNANDSMVTVCQMWRFGIPYKIIIISHLWVLGNYYLYL